MVMYSGFTHQKYSKMVIFHSYVSLPEGNLRQQPFADFVGVCEKEWPFRESFVREITGSWETSGNIASCTFSQRHTNTRTRANTHTDANCAACQFLLLLFFLLEAESKVSSSEIQRGTFHTLWHTT